MNNSVNRKIVTVAVVAILIIITFLNNQNMFWKKEYKAINDYPNNNWALAESGTKGKDYMLLRINKGIEDAIGHPDYPIRVGVAIPVNSLSDENPLLNIVEDKLNEEFEKNNSGVGVLAISMMDGKEFKELVFYTKETVNFKELHEGLQKAFPNLDIQFYAEKDPSWSLYAEYVK